MTSPAADWLPTNGKRPEGLADTALVHFGWPNVNSVTCRQEPIEARFVSWKTFTHYKLAPLPAQPAEVERCPHGLLIGASHGGKIHSYCLQCMPASGERAEATPACKHDFWPCAVKCKLCGIRLVDLPATINAGAEHGGQGLAATASQEAPAGEHAPVPAPQRQNLVYWLALRGRAPWPVETRATLPALPINAFKEWSK